ncbi:MAG: two-component regulator propeller domain-containing protein [Bacteroidota bacterium]
MKTLLSILVISTLLTGLNIIETHTIENGLPNNQVRVILNDSDGKIWAGSKEGVVQYDGTKWHRSTANDYPLNIGTTSIFESKGKHYWFGSLGKAISYDGFAYKTYSIIEDMGLQGRVVFGFHEDENGRIWVATTGGVAIYDGEQWKTLTVENGLSHNVIHDIKQDSEGNYWLATRKGGLNIYDGEKVEHKYLEKNCRKILKDNAGTMWVGTSDGIIKYDGTDWKVLEAGHTILPMFQGAKGYIWCVKDATHIIRINAEDRVIQYDNPTEGHTNEIYHLEQDNKGAVWAGTDQGIFVLH